jgi:hypothetical protein
MTPALLLLLALQNAGPINAQCPVRPNQKAKPANLVVYKGRIIGLC